MELLIQSEKHSEILLKEHEVSAWLLSVCNEKCKVITRPQTCHSGKPPLSLPSATGQRLRGVINK